MRTIMAVVVHPQIHMAVVKTNVSALEALDEASRLSYLLYAVPTKTKGQRWHSRRDKLCTLKNLIESPWRASNKRSKLVTPVLGR